MATASSRNPFLSPQGTGASSTTHGPSIHSAFADLNLGHEQPALLTPQHTAASTTSNNPFLDRPLLPSAATRPQQHPSESNSGRSLSVQELAELEGTAVAVTKRETAPRPAPVSSAPSGSAQQRPVSPQVEVDAPAVAYSTPNVSSSYVSSSQTRRVAEGNEDFRDDDEALEAAIQASLAESGISSQSTARPSSSSAAQQAAALPPPLPSRSKAETYAPPSGPPPIPAIRPPSPSPSLPPVDPPPAYTPASQLAESTIDAGPRVPDFARRPAQPLEPQRTGWSDGGGNPGGFLEPGDPGYRPLTISPTPSHSTLQSPYPAQPPQHHYTPPPPPSQRPQNQPSYGSSPSHNPGQASFDPTPSPVPIIGRPLLNNGATLVYPAGFQCYKCLNSGWKENDPTHPCRTCWKKYGRPYTTALALAWNPPPPTFQRPLGTQHRPMYASGPSSWASPPGMYRPVVRAPPVGSVVYQPGDPRIGGRLCHACGGSGLKIGFFEDDTCRMCGGVGRLF